MSEPRHPVTGLVVVIERSHDDAWPPLYGQLIAAYDADDNVPLTLAAWGPVRCRVLSWSYELGADPARATFHLVAERSRESTPENTPALAVPIAGP